MTNAISTIWQITPDFIKSLPQGVNMIYVWDEDSVPYFEAIKNDNKWVTQVVQRKWAYKPVSLTPSTLLKYVINATNAVKKDGGKFMVGFYDNNAEKEFALIKETNTLNSHKVSPQRCGVEQLENSVRRMF